MSSNQEAITNGLFGLGGILLTYILNLISNSNVFSNTGFTGITGNKPNRKLLKLIKKSFPHCTAKRVYLDKSDSGLTRFGVSHVIFARQTINHIFHCIPADTLFSVAKQIGKGAATELLIQIKDQTDDNTDDVKETLCTPQNVLTMLRVWDSTGGWGNYELISPNENAINAAFFATDNPGHWKIRIRNHFLATLEIGENRNWEAFWKGYFSGFCEQYLNALNEKYHFQINGCIKVENVVCNCDGNNSLTCDIKFIRG